MTHSFILFSNNKYVYAVFKYLILIPLDDDACVADCMIATKCTPCSLHSALQTGIVYNI